MAYCAASDIYTYLDIAAADDDTLISALIERAQAGIDRYCNRTFEASADTTRTFDAWLDTSGRKLIFDEDCASITTLVVNADAATPETVPSTDYVPMPRNHTPYYGLKLLSSSDYWWDYEDDQENAIEVTGKWAYSTEAPDDIVQACVRWAAYMYRQKDAQVFETTAIPGAGVIEVPQGIPTDVRALLKPYRKF